MRESYFKDLAMSDNGLAEALHNASQATPELKPVAREAHDLGEESGLPEDFKAQLQDTIQKLEALQSKKATKEVVGDIDTAALRKGLKELLGEK